MSADIETLYGLRGDNLARYREAEAIIDANMRRFPPELYLRAMRQQLEHARLAPNNLRSDAHVAIAANLLSFAIKVQS